MTTVKFLRPPRPPGPQLPRGELVLEPPPELVLPAPRGPGSLMTLLPLVSGLAAMALLFAGNPGSRTYLAGGLFGVSLLGLAANTLASRPASARNRDADRGDYLRYLSQLRRHVRKTAAQQRSAQLWLYPDPEALWSIAASRRRWERRPRDDDFGNARLAVGAQKPAVPLILPETRPIEELEPVSAAALRRFVKAHATVPNLPVALSLRAFGRVSVRGDRAPVLDLARAVLAQLVTFHAPDDLRIAAVVAEERRADWEWVKWLPHALSEERLDGAGPQRLVFASLSDLEVALAEDLDHRHGFDADARRSFEGRHLVVVLDGGATPADSALEGRGLEGATVLDLSGRIPPNAGQWLLALRITATGELVIDQGSRSTTLGWPDRVPAAVAEALARQLSPYRLAPTELRGLGRNTELLELLGLGDPAELDPERAWSPRPPRDRLRIPLGTGAEGEVVKLDLKESAADGMGPHGLVIGATGAGKSELLRSVVAALALTHDPSEVNFLLVDFRGPGTFASLDRLPHTSAVVAGLDEALPLVDRLIDAITGELARRQELLRSAGYPAHREYLRARRVGAPLAALPSLLIVCDEFGELLRARPDFIDVFVQIGRVGRSLGVHLLLASQRLEESRLRGLESYLSYRIGLRTLTAMESRMVLGVPDAYELPREPGHGWLKGYDTAAMRRFRGAYVSGAYRPPRPRAAAQGQVVEYRAAHVPMPEQADAPEPVDERVSTLDVVVDRLRGHGDPARPVWLPPLDRPVTLGELLSGSGSPARLAVPIGIVDLPFEQRQDPLVVDLSGPARNLLVVGAPGSGKTNLLRTLVAALAATHDPAEVQFLAFDFGGGGLAGLPRTAADLTHPEAADLVVVVDGWAGLERELPDVAARLVAGLGPSVHLAVAADRWSEIPAALRTAAGTRLELRLGEPADSAVDRRAADNVPAGRPGRGITAERLQFLAALSRVDEVT